MAKARGTLTPIKQPGRPEKFSERSKRRLKRTVEQDPSLSIAAAGRASGVQASHKTIVKILKEFDILSLVSVKVPKLERSHVVNRLRFANSHLDKDLNAWKRWTFSDESSIELDCQNGSQRYLIKRNQRYDPEFVRGVRQMGGGKIMIWSFISWKGVGPLLFIEGGIDGELYKEILRRSVLPHLLDNLGDDGSPMLYQDDGASCHDCDLVIEFCAAKGIQRPYWPPRSPDMNPIEYVWGWVKDKLSKLRVKPRNIAELKVIITRIWYEIPQENVRNLYRGMPKRIDNLRAVNGYNTHH